MKKLIAAILIILALPMLEQKSFGQEMHPVNEVNLSYGILTTPDMVSTLGAIFGSAFTLGHAQPDKMNCLGALNLGYYHWFNQRFAVGAETSVEFIRLTFKYENGKDADGNTIYKTENGSYDTYVTFMPSVKGQWLNRPKCGIYSKLSLGCMMQYLPATDSTDSDGSETHEDASSSVFFAGQFTPFGLELGGSHWRGFFEAGFGAQGLLLGGVRCRF